MGLQGPNQSVMAVIFNISCGLLRFSWISQISLRKYIFLIQLRVPISFKALAIKRQQQALKVQVMERKKRQSSLNYLFVQPCKLVMSFQKQRRVGRLHCMVLSSVKRLLRGLDIFLKVLYLNRWWQPLQDLMALSWLMALNTVVILMCKQNIQRYSIFHGQHYSAKNIQTYYPLKLYRLMLKRLLLRELCLIHLHQKVFPDGLLFPVKMGTMFLVAKPLLNVHK